MQIKKYKGQIFGAVLSPKEKKALDLEVRRAIAAEEQKFDRAMDAMVLYTLHREFGFGKDRLRRFYEAFLAGRNELIERYQSPEDNAWIAEQELKRLGVDLDAWSAEIKAGGAGK